MAKINTPKAFDKQLLEPAFVSKADLFIDFVNQLNDQVLRALSSQLTFPDNFKAGIQTISVSHGAATTITPPNTVTGAYPLNSSAPIRSYYITKTKDNKLLCTFRFDQEISVPTRNVVVSGSCAIYDVQNNTTISVGDVVRLSLHTNNGNNGSFVVIAATTTSITVVNPVAVAETPGSYVGSSDTQKSVSLLTLF